MYIYLAHNALMISARDGTESFEKSLVVNDAAVKYRQRALEQFWPWDFDIVTQAV